MKKWFLTFVLVSFVLVSLVPGAVSDGEMSWMPKKGDYITVDLENSQGYIFREDQSDYFSFPVVTGQKRNVYYIGKYYYAATPAKEWYIRSKNIQSDRITYAQSGEFLRLYHQGERTHYGFHGHRDAEVMMTDDLGRFRSMGCVIVRDDILDLLEEEYLVNDQNLKVVTTRTEVDLPKRRLASTIWPFWVVGN